MTKYEELMNKADENMRNALETTDVDLKTFYYNASKGYEAKAKNLTLKEAGEQVK